MTGPGDDRLMSHEYDGIREYDNPTPGWWHALFLLTILFSIFYFTFWEFSPLAWSNEEAWERRQVAEFRRVFGTLGQLAPDESTIREMMGHERMLAVARGVFETNCTACHARDGGAGGGMSGVNLTDDAYKNVRVLTDLYRVISQGAGNGAMPAWENRLSVNERVILAAYVATLRGRNVPGGKGPEGEVIPPWTALPAAPPR